MIKNWTNFVRRWADVSFLPGSLVALCRLFNSPYRMVIVINQSAIGRGIITTDEAMEINSKIVDIIKENGGRIDSGQMDPHSPQDSCSCRKPEQGMLFRACAESSLDLLSSILIGDS